MQAAGCLADSAADFTSVAEHPAYLEHYPGPLPIKDRQMRTSKPKPPTTEPAELRPDALDKVVGGRKAGGSQLEILLPPPPPPPPVKP
jgi:hypothetical protein